MAITVEPRWDTYRPDDDGKSKRPRVEFIVSGATTPNEALYAPGVPAIGVGPIRGDPFPHDSALKADAKSITQRLDTTVWIVEVGYSNDGSFRAPSIPPTNAPDYKEYSVDA